MRARLAWAWPPGSQSCAKRSPKASLRRADYRGIGAPASQRIDEVADGAPLTATARDALDLGAHHPLHHVGQIIVKPGLEHRLEHFAHQVFERAGVLH